MQRPIEVIDLFCGAGGLTRGLLDAKLNVVAGFDLDETCKYSYETNNKPSVFKHKSISEIAKSDVVQLYASDAWRVLVGCAPCQPFSNYTTGKLNENDERWSLLSHFARLIEELQPDVISMENVPGLQKHPVYAQFLISLKTNGYHIFSSVVNCVEYGIPQRRKRLVLLASKHKNISLIPPTHQLGKYVTVRDAIGNLPKIAAGETSSEDILHKSAGLSPLNKKRIRSSKPSGTWIDWPEEIRASCHQKETGESYKSVYARMEWDEPSPTITTQFYGFGNGRFGHPEQDRALSLREGAILQSFPHDYKFVPPNGDCHTSVIGKHIGNAVPVALGRAIGISIKKHLRGLNEQA